MMKTILMEKEKSRTGALQLVNAHHPLADCSIRNLMPVDVRFPGILMMRDAANILRLAFEKISAQGSIVPVSGYRSGKEQAAIYEESVQNNGAAFTEKYVALPGHSEHQTGFAIDLGLAKEEIDFICPDFPYEGICNAFRKISADYGFVERYAKGKEGITGISHEPWHFRYVGYPHAKIMEEKGMALEEYTEFIKEYRVDSRLVYQKDAGSAMEVYYVPVDGDETFVPVPDTNFYQISGNNAGGFVVTVQI